MYRMDFVQDRFPYSYILTPTNKESGPKKKNLVQLRNVRFVSSPHCRTQKGSNGRKLEISQRLPSDSLRPKSLWFLPLQTVMSNLPEAKPRSHSSNDRHFASSNTGPEKDCINAAQRDSLNDELDEHTSLVETLSHESLTSPIREQQPRINWFDASMHLIKGNLGPGCLNLPRAFSLSGWVLGTVLLVLVVVQGIYSMILLVEVKQILLDSNYRSRTFMDVAKVSLGSKGHSCVQVLLFVLQTGVCCVFLDLIATNLKTQTGLSTHVSIAWVTVALLLVVLVRYLKDLRLLSTTANVFMITAVVTAAVTAVTVIKADGSALPPKATSDFGDSVTFVSSMFFSFEGIGLVLPIGTLLRKLRFGSILHFLTPVCVCARFPHSVENAFTVASTPDEVRRSNFVFRTWVLPGE